MLEFVFQFRNFFFELLEEAGHLWPIEAYMRGSRAEFVSFEQRGHRRRNTREHLLRRVRLSRLASASFQPVLFLLTLQSFPVAQNVVRRFSTYLPKHIPRPPPQLLVK